MDGIATERQHRLIASDRVEGTKVFDRAGEKLGSIKNFMVGKRSGHVEYAVLQFGGVLGIGNDFYPIPWDMLSYDAEKGGYAVDLDAEKLNDAPRHAPEFQDYDHRYGRSVFEYYGLAYPFI